MVEVLTNEIRTGKDLLFLDISNPNSINENASKEDQATHKFWQSDSKAVKSILLASMSKELQRQFNNMDPHSIILNLKELYGE